ncbi:MAG: hypothetical protein NT159_00680, partial [Proteobacteria bacterium]|nr:hypothetical protein [Pseudomonadota bacterium]
DPIRLRELRHTLRPRMAASPLCNTSAFARKIENTYRILWQQTHATSAPLSEDLHMADILLINSVPVELASGLTVENTSGIGGT